MTLKLKTNRDSLILWIFPLLVIGVICEIALLIGILWGNDKSYSSKSVSIALGVGLGICICGILICKFYDRKLHIFSNDSIQVFEKKQLIDYINVKDIVEIKYIRCNIQYIWKRIEGTPRGGDACKMYVTMKQGNCYIIGCFSTRDAKKIKKLYGDLVQII